MDGPLGHAVDILAILATIFGVATSLGLGAQQINAGLNRLLGLDSSILVQLSLIGGGIVLRLRHAGTAHTKGSLVVQVLPDRTVFAGDILYGGRVPALIPDGSVKGWLEAFDALRALDGAIFVPGHGEITDCP